MYEGHTPGDESKAAKRAGEVWPNKAGGMATDTITMDDTIKAAEKSTCCRSSCRRIKPIPLTIGLAVVMAAGYAGYQRIGTTANAGLIEFTPNLAGGFLALGMTEDQPGFVLLSAMDRDKVEVTAVKRSSPLGGSHTILDVSTSRGALSARLRGPEVLLVSKCGAVESLRVDWSFQDFQKLKAAADCSHEASVKKKRCGAPFTDLHEAMVAWPASRVPDRVRAFLKPFAARRKR